MNNRDFNREPLKIKIMKKFQKYSDIQLFLKILKPREIKDIKFCLVCLFWFPNFFPLNSNVSTTSFLKFRFIFRLSFQFALAWDSSFLMSHTQFQVMTFLVLHRWSQLYVCHWTVNTVRVSHVNEMVGRTVDRRFSFDYWLYLTVGKFSFDRLQFLKKKDVRLTLVHVFNNSRSKRVTTRSQLTHFQLKLWKLSKNYKM